MGERGNKAATVGIALRGAIRRLAAAGKPELDARLLAQAAFGLDGGAALLLRENEAPDPDALARFEAIIERRERGEPVHRILGHRDFREHRFALSPETLEPRPDTETLVDLAAEALRHHGGHAVRFADLGTGSGAIAVSLLAMFPHAEAIAVDLSQGALRTAMSNARAAGVESRFHAVCGDYLAAVDAPLDLVVSNPPYIRTGDIATLSIEVREHDPHLALDGGPDGLEAYREIARGLRGRGRAIEDVLLEIGWDQAKEVRAIFETIGYRPRRTAIDLAGHERALWLSLHAR